MNEKIKVHKREEIEKKKLIARLRKIAGQVSGLEKMVESDRECIEVLRQINSISGALRGLWSEVLQGHLKGCIRGAVKEKSDALVEELAQYLKKAR